MPAGSSASRYEMFTEACFAAISASLMFETSRYAWPTTTPQGGAAGTTLAVWAV